VNKIYSAPFKVYLCLLVFALIGIYSGTQLPISLFPNSSKPKLWVSFSYGELSSKQFVDSYGSELENAIGAIKTKTVEVEKVSSTYNAESVSYEVDVKWGVDGEEAKKEIEGQINSIAAKMPSEVRDSLHVGYWRGKSGFIAISFYSPKRSLQELYDILNPLLSPHLSKVADADNPGLWNPKNLEINIQLRPETMAHLNLFPSDISNVVKMALGSYSGGTIKEGENNLNIVFPRKVETVESMGNIIVPTRNGKTVLLSQIANISFSDNSSERGGFRVNGSPSLILFASPKAGGNIKKMAEEIKSIVNSVMIDVPKDIGQVMIADPSEFIRSSVRNVIHEVCLGAGLAVFILFIFVGSFKNTITAAIEIPLSMVLAFILMKFFGVNLNLISLGGLALSAGMNVDASVVVMENIFRHFEEKTGPFNFARRVEIISTAVKEVMLPIVASTIASLVVFLPLALTQDLTNAILGDLAKAVVFSHGFSAIVALILVPTIRLQIMGFSKGSEKVIKSPVEKQIKGIENFYVKCLARFMGSKKIKIFTFASISILFVTLLVFVFPKLKREVIGTPDTEMMMFGVNTIGNTKVQQMETLVSEEVNEFMAKFSDTFDYTFTQISGPNNAWTMAKLKDKSEMSVVWKKMEEYFQNTPLKFYWVEPWNPSQLPIPNPPHLRVAIKGGEADDRSYLAQEVQELLRSKDVFPRIWSTPSSSYQENVVISPYESRLLTLQQQGKGSLNAYNLSDLVRVASSGKNIGEVPYKSFNVGIKLGYVEGTVDHLEDIKSFPIGVGDKIIPLNALAEVKVERAPPPIYRENGQDIFLVFGKEKKGDESLAPKARQQAKKLILEFQEKTLPTLNLDSTPVISLEDSEVELTSALDQLKYAILISIALIFLTLLLQFGNVVDSLIVLVAIPLGILGVILSLFIFQSTLSLNSALGVILLNGISVANSIILVDFMNKLVKQGIPPREAALMAGRKRLRPILITSLTSILGMMPIAFGLGEGGRILQPLGISVSGGLWVSTLFTLFIVPVLHSTNLERRRKKNPAQVASDIVEKFEESINSVETPPSPSKQENPQWQ